MCVLRTGRRAMTRLFIHNTCALLRCLRQNTCPSKDCLPVRPFVVSEQVAQPARCDYFPSPQVRTAVLSRMGQRLGQRLA
jgi:hypothetical protein